MTRKFFFATACLLFSGNFALDAEALEFNITPGSLSDVLKDSYGDISELKLTGEGNFTDLQLLADYGHKISVLDLSALKISSYKPPYVAGSENRSYNADFLPEYIFFNSNFESVTLPSSLTVIGEGAFANSKIENVTIGSATTSVGDYAFYNCGNLKTLSLNTKLSTIGKGAFQNCLSLSSVNIPASIIEISESAFENTRLISISIPQANIGRFAFANNLWLEKASLASGATMDEGILYGCSHLTEVAGSPPDVPALFVGMSAQVNPENILAGGSSMGDFAFYGNSASEMKLTGDVIKIGKGSFGFMEGLTKINVEDVATIPETDSLAFVNIEPSEVKLIVSAPMKNEWKGAYPWKLFNIMTNDEDTHVGEIKSNLTLKAETIGGSIRISSSENWKQLMIYSTSGMVMKSSANTNELSIPRSEIKDPIIIVSARFFDNSLRTIKLILQ